MGKVLLLSKRWTAAMIVIVTLALVTCFVFVSREPSRYTTPGNLPLVEQSLLRQASIVPLVSNQVILPLVNSDQPTLTPTSLVTARTSTRQQTQFNPSLISLGKPVTSSVRGNLGPASVVTNERIDDWLKDRWQAAKNMQGEPIHGEHWLQIDLQTPHTVNKIVIDWEQAYSNDWIIRGKYDLSNEQWLTLCTSQQAKITTQNSKHVVHEVTLAKEASVKLVRLLIKRPSTRWGSSVWRFQVWGSPA